MLEGVATRGQAEAARALVAAVPGTRSVTLAVTTPAAPAASSPSPVTTPVTSSPATSPATPTGLPAGAPTVARVSLIPFASGSADLTASGRARIAAAAARLRGSAGGVRIEGHADDVGGHALNLALSQERARAVRAALLTQGIPAERLTVAAHGDTQPMAPNRSPAGRATNRRVEILLVTPTPGAA